MDNKKYYYLKLKDNFYDSDAMIILENMENGYLYSNILMKMYLRSLKTDGRLMFNDRIPYNAQMLSKIVRHNKDVVEKAIEVFKELDLIEILDNGAIYMIDIQNYIGKSSTEGDRKRLYREKIKDEKIQIGQMSQNCPDIQPPEIEIEIEKEIDIDINNMNIIYNWDDKVFCENLTSTGEKCLRRSSYNINGVNFCNQHSKKILGNAFNENKIKKTTKFIKPTLEEIEQYCKERNNQVNAQKFLDYYESNGWKVGKNSMKDWKAAVRTWEHNTKEKETKELTARQKRDMELEKFLESYEEEEKNEQSKI